MDDMFNFNDGNSSDTNTSKLQQSIGDNSNNDMINNSIDEYEEINFLGQSTNNNNDNILSQDNHNHNNHSINFNGNGNHFRNPSSNGISPSLLDDHSSITNDSIKLNFQFDDFESPTTIKSNSLLHSYNNDLLDDENDFITNDYIPSNNSSTTTTTTIQSIIAQQQQQQQILNVEEYDYDSNGLDITNKIGNNETTTISTTNTTTTASTSTTTSNNSTFSNLKSGIINTSYSSLRKAISTTKDAISTTKEVIATTKTSVMNSNMLNFSTDRFWNEELSEEQQPKGMEDLGTDFEKYLRLGEDIPQQSWTKRLDYQFPEHKQFQVSFGQGFKLMGLGYRMYKYVKKEYSAGRVPIMDPFNMPKPGPVMGVPIGGIGSGSITRGWKGDFVRWNLANGIVTNEVVDANKFSVYIKMDDPSDSSTPTYSTPPTNATKRAVVLCPGKPKRNVNLDVWNWGLKGDKSNYFAMFPRAWTVYEEPHPDIKLVCKQVSPVIPHNYDQTSYPCSVFVWKIDNTASIGAEVSLMFTWQNGDGSLTVEQNGGHYNKSFKYSDVDQKTGKKRSLNGVTLHTRRDIKSPDNGGNFSDNLELSIGVMDDPDVTFSYITRFDTTNRLEAANLWYSFNKSGILDNTDDTRPNAPKKPIAAAIAAKVRVEASSTKEVVFAIGWDAPIVRFNSGAGYYRRYTKFFGTAGNNSAKIACEAAYTYKQWEQQINAWQSPILNNPQLPSFYKMALFNELYYFVDGGSVWTHGTPPMQEQPLSWRKGNQIKSKLQLENVNDPDYVGRFAYLESTEYLMYNTYDVHFYASFALVMLWPRLETSLQIDFADAALLDYGDETVECVHSGQKMPRKVRGAIPHDLGNPGEDPWRRVNSYCIQDVSRWKDLPCKFVLQVYRDYLANQDRGFLLQMWGVVEEAIRKAFDFDTDNDGVVDNEGFPDQTYDTWSASGCSAYSGGLWLASLKAAATMASVLGLREDETVYNTIFEKGKKSYYKKLWNGYYFNYDSSKNQHFNSIMADQLAGHWYLASCGLNSYCTLDQALSTLSIINEYNVKGYSNGNCGAVNGMRPDGSVDNMCLQSAEVWIGTTLSLAATMFLHYKDQDGWDIVKGIVESSYNRWGFQFQTPEAWDQGGCFRAATYMRPLSIWSIQWALERRSSQYLMDISTDMNSNSPSLGSPSPNNNSLI